DQITEQRRLDIDPDALPIAFGVDRADAPGGVHVTLHVVTAERLTRPECRLEVDLAPERLRADQRLDHDVEGEPAVPRLHDSETDPVDGDRVADCRRDPALHDEPPAAELGDAATLSHDAGEHLSKATATNEARARSGPLRIKP